ncbi:insecticidal delta-endotoxin Cry8Ea1 family protein, partial [Bacillus cereus]|uniref:insecticidal delta-endotoxin Cry8Ea1 family protein n=1 Tax=Bacillus cereus TaxID=1396 RepID=UPI000C024C3E
PNAKDGLYTPLGRVDTVLQNLDIGLSIRTALGILQMILAARSPALGRAAGLINLIFGFLWGTLGGQKTWESFMKAVEALVDQKITDAVRAKALSELEGVQNAVILYQEAADDWNENPNDESNKERVRRQFTSTNTVMEFAMPS